MIEPAILGRMMRTLLGDDIGRAADAAGMRVRRDATGSLDGFYLPARKRLERPRVVISSQATREERDELIARAIGHLVLGHRSQRVYLFQEAMHGEGEDATTFARALLESLPEPVDRRPIDFRWEYTVRRRIGA